MFQTKVMNSVDSGNIRILQLSDCHLFADETQRLLGVYTNQSFAEVVRQVELLHQQQPFDVMLITGDISQDYSPASYAKLCAQIEPLGIPWFWIPGNHDENTIMATELRSNLAHSQKHIVVDGWQIILLDSSVDKTVHGELSQEQLSFLQQCLEKHSEHAVVVMHHQPVNVGCEWLDNLGVKNNQQLWDVLDKFVNVKAVVWGHVHQEFQAVKDGVALLSTPSTCVQFKKNSDSFAASTEFPGFRYFSLKQDGSLESVVKRVEVDGFHVDHTIGGY